MKHIQRDFLKIREFVREKLIKVSFVSTAINLADSMTKPLQPSRFDKLVRGYMC